MGKPGFDFGKLISASLFVCGIGVLLVIFSTILHIVSLILSASGDQLGPNIALVSTVFSIVLFPLFFILYFWSGMNSVGKYGLDASGAGMVAALSYAVTGFLQIFLDMLLAVLFVTKTVSGSGFGSVESVIAASALGDIVGLKGIAFSALCGVGVVFLGSLINFVVGGCGALFVLRKYQS